MLAEIDVISCTKDAHESETRSMTQPHKEHSSTLDTLDPFFTSDTLHWAD
jgi:hypothetical protein